MSELLPPKKFADVLDAKLQSHADEIRRKTLDRLADCLKDGYTSMRAYNTAELDAALQLLRDAGYFAWVDVYDVHWRTKEHIKPYERMKAKYGSGGAAIIAVGVIAVCVLLVIAAVAFAFHDVRRRWESSEFDFRSPTVERIDLDIGGWECE